MRARRPVRAIAAGLVLTFALVACGQKPGVHVEGSSGGLAAGEVGGATGEAEGLATEEGLAADGATARPGDTGGAGGGDGGAAAGTTGGSGGAAGNGGSSGGSGGGGGEAAAAGGGGGSAQVQGDDRTGVTRNKITIGLHAPVTGAAPLPSTSFEESGDLYWRWITKEKGQTVLGRENVELIFRDDTYEPSAARQVCRDMADKAFAIGGGGGTDQIQACGQWAGRAQVPYFSAGVTEAGLEGNPWYYAVSMTYKQQGGLLAQYVKKNFGNKRAAAIITNTPNFDDAKDGWEQGVAKQGLDYYKTLRHTKGGNDWYRSFGRELDEAGVEVVYILTSPTDYIQFAQQSEEQGFDFQYVGVGVSMGLNAVLGASCDNNETDDGVFFSPFPALETRNDLDPEFQKAADHYGVPDDDIAWALWGIAKQQHEMFKRYGDTFGNDLTREDFRALVEAQGSIETGIYPEVGYSPQNHFGGKGVHVLKADCSDEEYKNAGLFKSGF